ncbi:MAG: hypothetical protein JSV24_09270, partial [Bacteroidales bacterium]
ACGGGSSDKETQKSDEEMIEEEATDEKIADCDEFLDKYDEWMNDYVDFLEAYMSGSNDPELAQKYTEVAQEAAGWASQWSGLAACVMNETYQKRFEEIAAKAEEKMKELEERFD